MSLTRRMQILFQNPIPIPRPLTMLLRTSLLPMTCQPLLIRKLTSGTGLLKGQEGNRSKAGRKILTERQRQRQRWLWGSAFVLRWHVCSGFSMRGRRSPGGGGTLRGLLWWASRRALCQTTSRNSPPMLFPSLRRMPSSIACWSASVCCVPRATFTAGSTHLTSSARLTRGRFACRHVRATCQRESLAHRGVCATAGLSSRQRHARRPQRHPPSSCTPTRTLEPHPLEALLGMIPPVPCPMAG
eukprot:Rmarinus@m.17782